MSWLVHLLVGSKLTGLPHQIRLILLCWTVKVSNKMEYLLRMLA